MSARWIEARELNFLRGREFSSDILRFRITAFSPERCRYAASGERQQSSAAVLPDIGRRRALSVETRKSTID
jgi:hypothetical protein